MDLITKFVRCGILIGAGYLLPACPPENEHSVQAVAEPAPPVEQGHYSTDVQPNSNRFYGTVIGEGMFPGLDTKMGPLNEVYFFRIEASDGTKRMFLYGGADSQELKKVITKGQKVEVTIGLWENTGRFAYTISALENILIEGKRPELSR